MTRDIRVGNESVTFRSSALLPIIYRNEFNREFFKDIQNMENDVAVSFNMAYAMYVHAGGKDSLDDFLGRFGLIDLVNAISDLSSMVLEETDTTSEPKKKSVK